MVRLTTWKAIALAAALFALLSTAAAGATSSTRTDVYWINDDVFPGDTVKRAWAALDRNLRVQPSRVEMMLHTRGLRAGHAYTVWWVVFNSPENCLTNPSGPVRCGLDFANPAARPAHLWAAGAVVMASGPATFQSVLEKGDNTHAAFPWEQGLTNPGGAEVHLYVRDHGPAVEGSDQTTSFNGGCSNPVPGGTGNPGNYPCENQQVAFFPHP